jgi:hypothetical protein
MRLNKNKTLHIERSILCMIALFETILKFPNDFIENEIVRSALKSQGGIASLNYTLDIGDNSLIISAMSLTTLKAKISTVSEGLTWKSFDDLRTQAYEAVEYAAHKNDTTSKQTKLDLKETLLAAETEIQKLREINLKLIQALTQAVSNFEGIRCTSNEDLRAKKAKDATEAINKILGLNDFPFNKLNRPAAILSLHPEKKS